ncbi:MAG: zinc metalloprotease, partial [Romboutsia sp.]
MNKFFKGIGFYLLIGIIIVGMVQFLGKPTEKVKEYEFSEVYRELSDENISKLYFINETAVEGTIKDKGTKFRTYMPEEVMGEKFSDEVLKQIKEGKITSIGGEVKPSAPWFVEMLPTLLLIFFILILWFVFMNQSQGGGGKVMNFGKSKAKVHKD